MLFTKQYPLIREMKMDRRSLSQKCMSQHTPVQIYSFMNYRGVLPSCVSMHHGHTVPVEARRRDGILLELDLEMTVSCLWMLELEPRTSEKLSVISTTEPHLSPVQIYRWEQMCPFGEDVESG